MKTIVKQIIPAFFASILTIMTSCNQKTPVDLIVHNANVYTVDNDFSKAQAFAVKDGKFVAVSDEDMIMRQYAAKERLMPKEMRCIRASWTDIATSRAMARTSSVGPT